MRVVPAHSLSAELSMANAKTMGQESCRETWKLNRESKGKPGFSEHQDSLMAIELLLLLLIKGRNLILPMCAFCSDSRCNKPNGSATLV